MQAPVMVLNQNVQRDTGRKAQFANIEAAKAIADIVRTTLGPQSMLKMLLDPMGGIVMTNDGNAILREVDVSHPSAKSMIEISRAQDEEVGDGTTSVIILAGEVIGMARPLLEKHNLHPTVIVGGYSAALNEALSCMDKMARVIDPQDKEIMMKLTASCVGTKFMSRMGDMCCTLALDAVSKVIVINANGQKEIDTKKYAKVEKIPGGELEDCRVLSGVMFNKDVTHPKMPRSIRNPRVMLLDCPLEYKKGESQTNIEITKEDDWNAILKLEEEYIEDLCAQIVRHRPDVLITEKGISDLAQHYLLKANVACIRRIRKTDNNRIARVCGATIVHRPDELQESDIGTGCGLFEVKKVSDDYFTYMTECKDPKACSIVLRGASKDVLMEMERNLADAMQVVRNVHLDPRLLPGGGAVEMSVSQHLRAEGKKIEGVRQYPYGVIGDSLEVIPRTLAQNCGAHVVRIMTELRAKHADGKNPTFGIDGHKGVMVDMEELGIWEPYQVKVQTIKTAIESACMLLRIDDIVSGMKKKGQ